MVDCIDPRRTIIEFKRHKNPLGQRSDSPKQQFRNLY